MRSSAISDTDEGDIFGAALYTPGETDGLPEEAVLASLGCGNPLAISFSRKSYCLKQLARTKNGDDR